MTGRGGGRKTLLAPIHFIFNLLQKRLTVSVWLYENTHTRIEGKIRGFDEFMNLVIDDAVEVQLPNKDKSEQRRQLGQILLKGDNVSLIQALD
ncbi:hypothetical protein LTR66_015400 [Elasticomyces elasticus]|nr:hypothetical protein LTR66_015400 [Elasticomyces elasticus]